MVYRRYFKSPPTAASRGPCRFRRPRRIRRSRASARRDARRGHRRAGSEIFKGSRKCCRRDPVCRPRSQRYAPRTAGFEIETFLQRAEMTFFLVKRGMQKNDAAAVRPYLNDTCSPWSHAASRTTPRTTGTCSWRASTCARSTSSKRPAAIRAKALLVHFDLVYRAKMLDDANRVCRTKGRTIATASAGPSCARPARARRRTAASSRRNARFAARSCA
jgi:hypothetical protein